MIITEQKPVSELLESLGSCRKIFLVGCGECAATCKTGGEAELKTMRALLEGQGKTVVGMCLPEAPCLASQIKIELAKNTRLLRQAEAVLVLACGLGVQSVQDNDRLGLVILPALNSICGALMDAQGNFLEKCSLCGECLLAKTGGICPITLCPKGLLNGPCGGMDKGKCEVDRDNDCAWVLIYKQMEKQGALGKFKEIQQPKDYKKALKPHKVIMTNG